MVWCEGILTFDELAEDVLFCGASNEVKIRVLTKIFEQIMGYEWDREECERDSRFAGDPLVEEAYQIALDNRKKLGYN